IAPMENILPTYNIAHAPHTAAYVSLVHLESVAKRRRNSFCIVWIDQHSARPQLLGSAGELAQYEHSCLVHAGCAKFLADQVHAVSYRGNQCDVCRAVIRDQIGP